tara:strand:- start:160 stop:393 length:234 start_codon:yes stop_codon:yes gene_type:complete
MQEDGLKNLISDMADDIRELVDGIETDQMVSMHHYEKYFSILSRETEVTLRFIMAAALVKAGANVQGVGQALKLLQP